jgi:hypothetical protein
MDHRHTDHGFARLGQILVIFGESAVAAEPPKCPLHNPPLRQQEEALGPLRPFDNVQADFPPGPQGPHPGEEVPAIGLIGPDPPQARELGAEDAQERHGRIAVLHISRSDHHGEQQPEGIDEDMPLATIDMFGLIVAVDPPFSVVLTDWLSITPALGCRCFPLALRTLPRRRSFMRCHVPSWRQARK